MNIESKFNKFIESGALDTDEAEFFEYDTCIIEFDNKEIKILEGK